MTQPEFHRRYQAYPDDFKAELIGGIVYVASPLRHPHGVYDIKLGFVLELYAQSTPGVEVVGNATTILGERSEPQPDLALRILQECGGKSRVNEQQYLEGPPELVAEIAHSSRDTDLGRKRQDYKQAGVQEYLVLCVADEEIHWFDFRRQQQIKANRQGIARSRVFPGLWLDVAALLALNSAQLVKAVQQGSASDPQATFVKRLKAARRQRE